MTTIAAKSLKEALAKARNVGLVEEAFTIEGCHIVLRNLRPDELSAIVEFCRGLEDVPYMNQWQKCHLAYAIVELDGTDLRDVTRVQIEEEGKKPIKVELHQYLLDHVVNTWSREAVWTAFRKFSDVVQRAEDKAKEGVQFLVPDETNEEKYRRLLLEAKALEDELPTTLIDSILNESGLSRMSSAAEVKSALARVEQLAADQEFAKQETPPSPEPVVRAETPEVVVQAPKRVVQDPHAALQQAIAARKAPAPDTVEPAIRSSSISAIEGAENDPQYEYQPPTGPVPVKSTPTENGPMVIDAPPQGGINPRFRQPARS